MNITNDLLPLPPLALLPGLELGVSVYCWNEEKSSVVKFLAADQSISEENYAFLVSKPSLKLFIEKSSADTMLDSLLRTIQRWLPDQRIPKSSRTKLIVDCISADVVTSFTSRDAERIIETTTRMSEIMADIIEVFQINGRDLLKNLNHDCSLTTHSINTAFLSLLIAYNLGYHGEALAEICSGAFLHDIGRLEMSGAHKNHTNLPVEFEERMHKAHTVMGFRTLCNSPKVSETALLMCYQHHECINGSGFPVGIHGNEIQHASRICAVAAKFNELTSEIAHRPALSRDAALRVLESNKNASFDAEVVKCLEQIMSQNSKN